MGLNHSQRKAAAWKQKQDELGRKRVAVYLSDDEQQFLKALSKGSSVNDGIWQLIQLARVNSK
jgi:hypothetical protein